MANLMQQKTLFGPIEFAGRALHTGAQTSVRVLPAEPDTGYRFVRTDLPGASIVRAAVHNIRDTQLATSLGFNGTAVKTVEHLLSALAGSGIDNALIQVHGDEIPILDGSASPFVRGIEDIGVTEQGVPKKLMRVRRAIEAGEGGSSARLEPYDAFTVNFTIDFAHPTIGRQNLEFCYSPEAYRREISFARTFGLMRDVQRMAELGLAQGGSLENAVVVGDDGVLNPEGLRSPDEFVRHKILDTIGDLSLVGIPIIGRYVGYKAGHRINRLLMQEVLNHPGRWELVHIEETGSEDIVFRPAPKSFEQSAAAAF